MLVPMILFALLVGVLLFPLPIQTHWRSEYTCKMEHCQHRSRWSTEVSFPCNRCGAIYLWGEKHEVVRYVFPNVLS